MPEEIWCIQMLSGHWLALKGLPDGKLGKTELYIYNLKFPDQPLIPTVYRNQFYYDHYGTNNEEFRFYGLTLDTTKHTIMRILYRILTDGNLIVDEIIRKKMNFKVKKDIKWYEERLSWNNYCVYNLDTTGTSNLYIFRNGRIHWFPAKPGRYIESSLKETLILLRKGWLSLVKLRKPNEEIYGGFLDGSLSHAFDNDEFGQGCMMHALADTKSVQSIATVHAPTRMATAWLNSGSCGSKYGIRMERCKIMHIHQGKHA
jgi:hypothetical protein